MACSRSRSLERACRRLDRPVGPCQVELNELQFRGWIDDLLKTSWEACQGTDVLIESPSAMGGIHIAEALCIPYYRAFTMTWTRTRCACYVFQHLDAYWYYSAYPHAFAVPEHKMGGGYNYMVSFSSLRHFCIMLMLICSLT